VSEVVAALADLDMSAPARSRQKAKKRAVKTRQRIKERVAPYGAV
jgi:hypothetical protein